MGPGQNGAERLPLWFIEGMAEYLSLGSIDPNTAMWLRDAAREEQLPDVKDLDNPKYFPYRWGQAFWAYVGGRWGDQKIRQMLDIAAKAADPLVAIKQVLGLDEKQFSSEWHDAIRSAYEPVLSSSTQPSDVGQALEKGKKSAGDLNVAPALSPDGKYLAFLSERSLFSIDLYIADAATGKVLHKLTSTASDPHYSSIQFIYSAGAWDAESRRIAIATVTSGRPALAIFDAASGDRQSEIRIPDVDEIFNPTWSPDGRSICFTGMVRGLTDLFIVDVQSKAVRQLTHDPYADLQPAWSPDGQRIAFATDRFSSDLATLRIGAYRIGFIDPATGRISQAPAFTTGKNINPQWGKDSQSLYFIADRDGIPNVYRMSLPGGDVSEVTAVGTGISGITSTSPAMSVASGTGTVAVSVYDDGRYDIYSVSPRTDTAPMTAAAGYYAGALPPIQQRQSSIERVLNDPQFGLPSAQAPQQYTSVPYKSSLHLEALGQPTIAIGASRYGAALGGGISGYFSDMLGNQTLSAGVDVNTGFTNNFSLKDTAAQVGYLNQTHRWNWGVIGGQVPYFSGGIQEFFADVNGEPSLVDQTIIYRQTERSVAAMTAYPFNRSRRVEFQAGATQISFDQIVQTQAYSLNTGELFVDHTDETSLGHSLTLGTASTALVYDTSNFGATSPVQGERYRLEASPTFGSVNYTSLLADYRRYLMPVSFYTIAARVMHYGRYGSGAEDPRFFPLFIGYPDLVRGYDPYSITPDECGANATTSCPAFDRLVGSRMLVGNLEFRFPLLRPFTGTSGTMYGPVPVEVALFADGGVAWNRGEKPSIFGGDRHGVSSAGVTFRVNLLGFAVGEFDFVKPFQRPTQGWMFQFNLSPGF
jgi:Tol biopolymer transport system component